MTSCHMTSFVHKRSAAVNMSAVSTITKRSSQSLINNTVTASVYIHTLNKFIMNSHGGSSCNYLAAI